MSVKKCQWCGMAITKDMRGVVDPYCGKAHKEQAEAFQKRIDDTTQSESTGEIRELRSGDLLMEGDEYSSDGKNWKVIKPGDMFENRVLTITSCNLRKFRRKM